MDLRKDLDLTYLFITHDLDEAIRVSVAAEQKALDMSEWELAAQIRERRRTYLP